MIELGRYAAAVWLAYGVTALLVGGITVQSLLAARAVKARLGEAEGER